MTAQEDQNLGAIVRALAEETPDGAITFSTGDGLHILLRLEESDDVSKPHHVVMAKLESLERVRLNRATAQGSRYVPKEGR